MMNNMYQVAGLSRVFTNHCLQVTAISVLCAHGVDGEDICNVSRHRSTDGLKLYCQGPTDKKRYDKSKHIHETEHSCCPRFSGIGNCSKTINLHGGITGLSHCDRDTDMETESAVMPVVSSPMSDCLDSGILTQVATSTAISNHDDTVLRRALHAGAGFEANCAPVFNFHGNFHFN